MSRKRLQPWSLVKKNSHILDRNPFNPLQTVQSRIDDIFDNAFSDLYYHADRNQSNNYFFPAINFSETDDAFNVTVETPGVDKKDIKLEVQDNHLVISGEKNHESSGSDKNNKVHYSESCYGSFYRSIVLPNNIDPKNVDAKFNNGVLTITIAKSNKNSEDTKSIEIK